MQDLKQVRTKVFNMYTDSVKSELIKQIKESMDCLVNLNTIEERVIIGQGFMVTGGIQAVIRCFPHLRVRYYLM